MTAYPHAHALREGANTSARPRMFRGRADGRTGCGARDPGLEVGDMRNETKVASGPWATPKESSGLDTAFGPKRISDFLPAQSQIPKEFWDGRTKWNKIVSQWFFSGLKGDLVPKDGIDRRAALGHLKTVLVSFEPQHEHKEAGAAYLMSLWFEDFKAASNV